MSDILKSTGMEMPIVSQTLFTAPAATTIILLSGGIYNGTAETITVTLSITKSAGSTISLVTAFPVVSGGLYSFPSKTVLEPDDVLSGFASIAGASLSINYVEHGDVIVSTSEAYDSAIAAASSETAASISASEAAASAALVDTTIGVDLAGSTGITQDLDLAVDNVLQIAPTADLAITFSNYPVSGEATVWFVELTGAGDYTMTWPAEVSWDNATEPTWATGIDTSIAQFYTRDAGSSIPGRILMEVV